MLDQLYRRRLEADLDRWRSSGAISADAASSIRRALGPPAETVTVVTIIGIVGGLLIAAAFLAFVAANWDYIPRPARLATLLGAIVATHALGALFARADRRHLADLSATVGALIFGATIALVGQMYHLSSDFAAGLLLWVVGAFVGAILTQSRGALAVALAVAVVWGVVADTGRYGDPHWPFLLFWFCAALVAIAWNAPSGRHLAVVALVAWWIASAFRWTIHGAPVEPAYMLAAGAMLIFGAGLALQARGPFPLRLFGTTLATYGAFGLAFSLILPVLLVDELHRGAMLWTFVPGIAGIVLAAIGAVLSGRVGPWLAAGAIVLLLLTGLVYEQGIERDASRWVVYALALGSGMCLVLSGAYDEDRPRLVAGWIGLGLVIASITWAVKGTLLMRSLFLAVAGGAAILLALALGRVLPKEATR